MAALAAGEAKQTWLDEMATEVGKLVPEAGTAPENIEVAAFLACFEERAARVYDILFGGMSGRQLKSDLEGNINHIKNGNTAAPAATLNDLIAARIAAVGLKKVKKESSGPVLGLLWFTRGVNFICTLIEKIASDDSQTPSAHASATYKEVLKPYHGWLTSKFCGTMMGSCPSKDSIMQKFGYATWDEAKVAMANYVAVMRPVVQSLLATLEANQANFPDKV